jgi:prepilin-type N-terminal cleavage/methylation domain-containing protein
MKMNQQTPRRTGFTLIEMMVVIAIIGLLLAALLPAFSTVRTKARYAQANAQFGALDTGLVMFRSEFGTLPPSAGDLRPELSQYIADPKGESATELVQIAGAHLLFQAMLGADGLGTPGFKDVDRNGSWANDTHCGENGIYAIDKSTGKELHARYGGAGYVDEKMKERVKSLADLETQGVLLNLASFERIGRNEPLFVDPWDTPILYYRANSAALCMVGGDEHAGIYWQEDNGIITGSDRTGKISDGLDFGSGKVQGSYHAIHSSAHVEPITTVDEILTDPKYAGSFARFIINSSIKARPTPVNKDSYLLINAGPDARYGTEDDVTNWKKATE